jgi:hypothetical protein
VDGSSTPTSDNFTVEYVHFEEAGGVGSSPPLSMSTPVPESPPTSVSATPPGMSTPAPAHIEPSPVEFTTPFSHDEERIDACYDGKSLRYRMMEDILGDQPVLGLVPHDLDG